MQIAPGINSGSCAFLIYVNDMAKVSSLLLCSILFADDTNTFISGKTLPDLYRTMNSEMIKIVDG